VLGGTLTRPPQCNKSVSLRVFLLGLRPSDLVEKHQIGFLPLEYFVVCLSIGSGKADLFCLDGSLGGIVEFPTTGIRC
jgi:hypothetical protein